MKMMLIVLLMVLLFGLLPVQAQSACPVATAVNFAISNYGNGFTAVQVAQPDGYMPIQRSIVYSLPISASRPIDRIEFDIRASWSTVGSDRLTINAFPGVDCNEHGFAGQFSWSDMPSRIDVQDAAQNGVWYHSSYPWIPQAMSDLRGYANPPDEPILYLVVVLSNYNQNTTVTGLQIDVRNISITYSS
jgi:hypothetical protein